MNAETELRLLGSTTIPRRFRGPKGCGNGGYTSGLLASYLPVEGDRLPDSAGPIEVTLRQPSPLDAPLVVTADGHGVQLRTDEGAVVAEATFALPRPREVVESVSYEQAGRAEAAYGGRDRHPFPECFVCGTSRTPDDALCLRPGALGDGRTACTWVPSSSVGVDLPVMWAVLDCPSGWTADVVGRPIVLGRILATVDALPALGTRCVVMGELLGEEGPRKVHTASTVYDEDGRLLASARQVWIAVDPTAFGED